MITPLGAVAHEVGFAGRTQLTAHSEEFKKRIVEVADGVYVAIGYSASNVTLIKAEGGSIIVDTSANPVDAKAIIDAFGENFVRPVRAIVYTHNHPDHTGGANVFAGTDKPEIYGHPLLEAANDTGRGRRDGGDAFGVALPDSQFINAGTQLEYGRNTPHTREGFLSPTELFTQDGQRLKIAGVDMTILYTPGEADENVAVWLPAAKALIAGDVFLKTFPNIAPLRGLPARPTEKWVESLDKMIAVNAEQLIPGHMSVVSGKNEVRNALVAYREGIDFVHTRTMEGIRKGKTPEELVQEIKLPKALADSPYLQEYYGTVAWSVRGIYARTAGWFDGNPTNIFPLTARQRAEKIVAMAGGQVPLLKQANAALAAGEWQWAAEQADYVLALAARDAEATRIKVQALREMGERQVNATARNYYLTVAQSLEKSLSKQGAK